MEKVVISDAVRSALESFRAKGVEGRQFLVLGYEGKNVLKVIANGPGFVAEALAELPEAECRYVYLRTDHQVEQAKTTKYAWLDFTPDAIAPMRKALLSTHKGQIRDLLQPISISIQASQLSELSEEIVMDRIAEASGTKSNVTKKAAFSSAAVDISRSAAAKEDDYIPASAKSNRSIQLADEAAIKQAFKDVRSDSAAADWALLGFTEGDKFDTLELKQTGAGGVVELAAALDATRPSYALFRTREQIDKTSAVRFSFLRVVPTTLPPSKKAQIGTLGGAIQELFKPYAFDFDYGTIEEFDLEVVTHKISASTGTQNMSLSSAASQGSKVVHPLGSMSSPSNSQAGPSSFLGQPSGTIALNEDLVAALKAIRSDAKNGEEQTQWIVASKIAGKDGLSLLASGTSSSVDQLKSNFEADNCNFALLRVIDQIDNSSTVKFVFVRSQPEATAALKKSAVSTKLGLYQAVFSPFSTEFFISSPDELTQENVVDKVSSASGSKSKVVASKA